MTVSNAGAVALTFHLVCAYYSPYLSIVDNTFSYMIVKRRGIRLTDLVLFFSC
jgi:hypothetical protein